MLIFFTDTASDSLCSTIVMGMMGMMSGFTLLYYVQIRQLRSQLPKKTATKKQITPYNFMLAIATITMILGASLALAAIATYWLPKLAE